jgi:hypothetical protein
VEVRVGDFGEVRSWVGDANPFAWGRLCAALSTWPHDARFFGEVLPYVQSHIAKWPDEVLRWSQPSWVAHAIREGDNPLLSLCNAVRADQIELTAQGLEVLGSSAHLGGVRALYLVDHGLGPAHRRALIASPGWTGLRDLDVRRTDTYPGDWDGLHGASFVAGLERLWVSERERDRRPRWRRPRSVRPYDVEPNKASVAALARAKARATR